MFHLCISEKQEFLKFIPKSSVSGSFAQDFFNRLCEVGTTDNGGGLCVGGEECDQAGSVGSADSLVARWRIHGRSEELGEIEREGS